MNLGTTVTGNALESVTMDYFSLFDTQDYTFLQFDSTAEGNTIVEEFAADGVVRLRDGMMQDGNTETYESASSIHIRPSEPFVATLDGKLIGHGVRILNHAGEPLEYRIIGCSEAPDYEQDDAIEFYRCTLKREDKTWDESELPLE